MMLGVLYKSGRKYTNPGDTTACDDYTKDVEVTLTAEGRQGRWEVEGGRDEISGYLKQASAMFTVMRARTESRSDEVKIDRSGFPWISAKVAYRQRTSVQAVGGLAVEMASEDTITLVRTWSGLKIKSVESKSTGGL